MAIWAGHSLPIGGTKTNNIKELQCDAYDWGRLRMLRKTADRQECNCALFQKAEKHLESIALAGR